MNMEESALDEEATASKSVNILVCASHAEDTKILAIYYIALLLLLTHSATEGSSAFSVRHFIKIGFDIVFSDTILRIGKLKMARLSSIKIFSFCFSCESWKKLGDTRDSTESTVNSQHSAAPLAFARNSKQKRKSSCTFSTMQIWL